MGLAKFIALKFNQTRAERDLGSDRSVVRGQLGPVVTRVGVDREGARRHVEVAFGQFAVRVKGYFARAVEE